MFITEPLSRGNQFQKMTTSLTTGKDDKKNKNTEWSQRLPIPKHVLTAGLLSCPGLTFNPAAT